MRTPSLVPGNDTTIHLVLNDFGRMGCAYVETDESKADEWTIIRNIADGQYSNPVRVVAFNVAEGWSRDVTKDVAQALFDLGRPENSFSPPAREFVERILGIALSALDEIEMLALIELRDRNTGGSRDHYRRPTLVHCGKPKGPRRTQGSP